MTTISSYVPNLDLRELSAFRAFQVEQEREGRKLRLSKMSFIKDAFHFRSSILYRIAPSVLFVTAFATFIAAADLIFDKNWRMSNTIIPHISVVVGLLLVFRNTTSYDRWYEGRKDWQNCMSDIRALARFIWLNVDITAGTTQPGASAAPAPAPVVPAPKKGLLSRSSSTNLRAGSPTAGMATVNEAPSTGVTAEQMAVRLERKRRAIRLLVSFMYATKHHLRGEVGVDWDDFDGVLPPEIRSLWSNTVTNTIAKRHALAAERADPLFPSSASSSPGEVSPNAQQNVDENGERDVEAAVAGCAKYSKNAARQSILRSRSEPACPDDERTPLVRGDGTLSHKPAMALPLYMLHELGRYFAGARKAGMLDDSGPAGFNMVNSLINNLTAQLGSMERIATTSIPVIYGIHLKQCVLMYLLALPLTLVQDMSWRMVPFVTLVAITLIGLEGIASECEMPFGNDPSDLPLDLFAAELRHELEHMMVALPEGADVE